MKALARVVSSVQVRHVYMGNGCMSVDKSTVKSRSLSDNKTYIK